MMIKRRTITNNKCLIKIKLYRPNKENAYVEQSDCILTPKLALCDCHKVKPFALFIFFVSLTLTQNPKLPH